jgi:hypothetical protein
MYNFKNPPNTMKSATRAALYAFFILHYAFAAAPAAAAPPVADGANEQCIMRNV